MSNKADNLLIIKVILFFIKKSRLLSNLREKKPKRTITERKSSGKSVSKSAPPG